MTPDSCRQYLEDPDAHASHIQECASCRAMVEVLERPTQMRAIDVEQLPLAAWEGSSHRSWPLVAGGALALLAIAAGFFAAAGASPSAITDRIPSLGVVLSAFRLAGTALQNAPMGWQVGIAISFILVNALLFALLRRAPKGIDV